MRRIQEELGEKLCRWLSFLIITFTTPIQAGMFYSTRYVPGAMNVIYVHELVHKGQGTAMRF